MFFEFNILGLLISFMLLVIYKYKNNKKNLLFNLILWGSYILELLHIITYVSIKNNANYLLFSRLYSVCLILLMLLFSVYGIIGVIKEKYKYKNEELNNKLKLVKISSIISGVILSIFILTSSITLFDGKIVFLHNTLSIIMWSLVIFNYLVILLKNCYKLIGFNSLIFLMMVGNYFYPEIGVINSFMVFIPLVLYMFYENNDKSELEKVKLERDYANRNIIDKYAFLKNISYEIRGPINTIDGLSSIVIDSKDEKEIKEDLKDIKLASHELIDIINGMIDLSIIESGNLEIINDNYNVYDMFENITNIINSKLKDKNVKFISKISQDIPEILLGDVERISQIVLNLLGNSVKFTKKGSINLEVSSVKNAKMVRLIIKVSDTGEGIKKEELDRLFDRKSDNSIGLVLASHLTKLMNGKIEVNSEYGKGTTFTVSIDQKIIKEHDIKPFKATGKRVLVVDDNKLNLKVVTKMLNPYDVEVIEASSGNECLDILEKDTDFDLILMDDMMPKLSGSETLSIIKKISRIDGYYIPIVVLTANVTQGIREKYLGVGFDDYLAKPIEKSELSRILKKYLKSRKRKNNVEE